MHRYVVPLVVVALALVIVAVVKLRAADEFEDTAFALADVSTTQHPPPPCTVENGACVHFDARVQPGHTWGRRTVNMILRPQTKGALVIISVFFVVRFQPTFEDALATI